MSAATSPATRTAHRPGELDRRLAHAFTDRSLLDEALTHASMLGRGRRSRPSNERLEFLGDRVLGLVIAARLIERFPKDPEGDLSRRQAALVRRETLAEIARDLDLGAWLEVARSEEEGGGRNNPAILADCLEAVIGALFLDGGLAAAEGFVRRQWEGRIEAMATPPRDAKTALQEWAQGRGLARPVYEVVRAEGPPHAPIFEVRVSLSDLAPLSASAPSKRAAEQAAADAMLRRLAPNGTTSR